MIPTGHYLFLSLALLLVGVIGVWTRRNALVVLMSIELMLNAVTINLVAFSRYFADSAGQSFALLVMVLTIAQAAVGAAMIAAYFPAERPAEDRQEHPGR